jgi:hypothetical protein
VGNRHQQYSSHDLTHFPSHLRALDVLVIMTLLLVLTLGLASFFTPEDEKEENDKPKSSNGKKTAKTHKQLHKEFDSFRHKYILVYLVIMLADWMQGTHM